LESASIISTIEARTAAKSPALEIGFLLEEYRPVTTEAAVAASRAPAIDDFLAGAAETKRPVRMNQPKKRQNCIEKWQNLQGNL
jgi:hypothetical protein